MTGCSIDKAPDIAPGESRPGTAHAAQQDGTITLGAFVTGSSQRLRRTRRLLLVLTLAAGWTDALCFLALSQVFASFVTGNIVFIGLSLAQRNVGLFVRAGVAVLILLLGVTLGSRHLQMRAALQTERNWRKTLARYLIVEAIVLLAFALLWALTGNPTRHPMIQVIVLGIAALGMGLQGALVASFNIPDVISVALTATELLLGMRLAQSLDRRPMSPLPGTRAWFLLALILAYALAAVVVALAMSWIGIVFVPCLLIAGAAGVVHITPRDKRFMG